MLLSSQTACFAFDSRLLALRRRSSICIGGVRNDGPQIGKNTSVPAGMWYPRMDVSVVATRTWIWEAESCLLISAITASMYGSLTNDCQWTRFRQDGNGSCAHLGLANDLRG